MFYYLGRYTFEGPFGSILLSTTVITQPLISSPRVTVPRRERRSGVLLVSLLTCVSLGVHGYHPYAEDGGLYTAGIKRLLNPALYADSAPFVDAHLRYSVFAPSIAALARLTHSSLPALLFVVYLASIWATLFAAWLLAKRCFPTKHGQVGAVTLIAAWLTIPIAGTSLMMMDPYVTARSISFPCTLLALVAALDAGQALDSFKRRTSFALCGLMLLLAAVTHPLMAGYAFADVAALFVFLASKRTFRVWGAIALSLFAVIVGACVRAASPAETPDYIQVAITRYYWFLSRWQWYEILGLVAPVLLLAGLLFLRRDSIDDVTGAHRRARTSLTMTAILSASSSTLIALLFAHEHGVSHLVARLQPLRSFQVVYFLMILSLGAALGDRLLRRRPTVWIAGYSILAGIMFFVQRSTYPFSTHLETPGAAVVNGWEQGFVWISHNTPEDSLFALDADYISRHGEDAQSFRAIAERSSLPDYSKDGGEASITPLLTNAWKLGQTAQRNLSEATDPERITRLRPFNVKWVVLEQHAKTSFQCPYQNSVVRVCRLP